MPETRTSLVVHTLVMALLPPASEGGGKVIFSLCVSVHILMEGGTPSGQPGGVPQSGPDWGVPHPRSGWGYPILGPDGRGIPLSQVWKGGTPSKIRMGVPLSKLDGVLLSLKSGWSTPLPIETGWGTPPIWAGCGTPSYPGLDGVPLPPTHLRLDGACQSAL